MNDMRSKVKSILDKWLPDMFPEQSQSKEYFVNELMDAFQNENLNLSKCILDLKKKYEHAIYELQVIAESKGDLLAATCDFNVMGFWAKIWFVVSGKMIHAK